MTEAALHRQVAKFLDAALCPEVFWTTIPAGGGGKVRGAHLKVCGYKAGTPDILIVHNGGAYWLELKTKKGRVSEAQDQVMDWLADAWSPVAVARSLDDVQDAVLRWGIPLRGALS